MNILLIVIAVIAVILLFTGGFVQSLNFLLWVGIVLLVIAVIIWLVRMLTGSRKRLTRTASATTSGPDVDSSRPGAVAPVLEKWARSRASGREVPRDTYGTQHPSPSRMDPSWPRSPRTSRTSSPPTSTTSSA